MQHQEENGGGEEEDGQDSSSHWEVRNTCKIFIGKSQGKRPGFVVDKMAPGQVFSEYFGFPCHSFHQILHPHNHPG
jgi:hypothetical protein